MKLMDLINKFPDELSYKYIFKEYGSVTFDNEQGRWAI